MSRTLSVVASLATLVTTLGAQDTTAVPPHPVPNECYGFSFGTWKPPLDWEALGHAGTPDTAAAVAGERGVAARSSTNSDSTLVLFPPWWPAGVVVRFTTSITAADTLDGVATALVADGNKAAPTAPVRAWRTSCRRAVPGR